jgi:hypothetical protein
MVCRKIGTLGFVVVYALERMISVPAIVEVVPPVTRLSSAAFVDGCNISTLAPLPIEKACQLTTAELLYWLICMALPEAFRSKPIPPPPARLSARPAIAPVPASPPARKKTGPSR